MPFNLKYIAVGSAVIIGTFLLLIAPMTCLKPKMPVDTPTAIYGNLDVQCDKSATVSNFGRIDKVFKCNIDGLSCVILKNGYDGSASISCVNMEE